MPIQEVAEQDVTAAATTQPCAAAAAVANSMAVQELADEDEIAAATMRQLLATVAVDAAADY